MLKRTNKDVTHLKLLLNEFQFVLYAEGDVILIFHEYDIHYINMCSSTLIIWE